MPYAYPYVLPYAVAMPEKRLSPATIIVSATRVLRSIVIVMAYVLYQRIKYGRGDTFEVIAALVGGLGVLGAVIKYVTTTYSIREGALHVRTGLLVRQDRAVPLERIQNINQKQNLVHRLLGVVDVHVETASGGGAAEVVLSVISFAEADVLRQALAQRTPHVTDAPHPVEPTGEVVYRASLGNLILAGATTNKLGRLLGAAIAMAASLQAFTGHSVNLGHQIGRSAQQATMPAWPTIAAVLFGLILLGWIASIVLTVVGKYGFQLVRMRGQLERSFGLITRHHSIFPVQRVQMLRIVSPFLQRRIGLCHVSAETAGSFREESTGHDPGTSELCPILRTRDADAMCRLALPRFSFDALDWTRTSKLALWRSFVRLSLVMIVAVVAVALLVTPLAWWAMLAAPVIAWPLAWLAWRAIGYCLRDGFLTVKSGVFTRTIRVVPLEKVQASFVTQSPLQRSIGLSSLAVLTAGATFGNRANVPDLQHEVALSLQAALHATPVNS